MYCINGNICNEFLLREKKLLVLVRVFVLLFVGIYIKFL